MEAVVGGEYRCCSLSDVSGDTEWCMSDGTGEGELNVQWPDRLFLPGDRLSRWHCSGLLLLL